MLTFLGLDEEPEITSECGGQYFNTEILLLIEDKIARGNVEYQKHDA